MNAAGLAIAGNSSIGAGEDFLPSSVLYALIFGLAAPTATSRTACTAESLLPQCLASALKPQNENFGRAGMASTCSRTNYALVCKWRLADQATFRSIWAGFLKADAVVLLLHCHHYRRAVPVVRAELNTGCFQR